MNKLFAFLLIFAGISFSQKITDFGFFDDEFTPKSIQGLKAWFEANPSDLTLDGSNYVSRWKDKSGNGNDLLQATALNQPLFSGNEIIFDGSSDCLVNLSLTIAQPYTIYLVMKHLTLTQYRWLYGTEAGSDGLLVYNDPPDKYGLYSGKYLVGQTIRSIKSIYRIICNSTASSLQIGSELVTADVGTNSMTRFVLGARGNQVYHSNIAVSAVILYNKSLTSNEDAYVKKYLAKKYGVTL